MNREDIFIDGCSKINEGLNTLYDLCRVAYEEQEDKDYCEDDLGYLMNDIERMSDLMMNINVNAFFNDSEK